MSENPLVRLKQLGQSVWLDYIRRDILHNGKLEQLINEDGLSGMTSNPAIFEKAVSNGDFYDDDILRLSAEGKTPVEIFDAISIADVQAAADHFYKVYRHTNGWDGYVSIEVNPHLALDTDGTVKEARRLWMLVNRPNVYIKVPATEQGIVAVERLVSEGININITLLFGLKRYRQVTEAYIRGVENMLIADIPVEEVSSVASFFVSRMDTMVDPMITEFIGKNGEQAHFGAEAYGKVGTANAIMAHEIFRETFFSENFEKLKIRGADIQRLLWASTGTKNPEFSDVKYIDALAIPGTINTLPPETIDAYRDHGKFENINVMSAAEARKIMNYLPEMGISIDKITEALEREGIEKFNEPYDKMIKTLQEKVKMLVAR